MFLFQSSNGGGGNRTRVRRHSTKGFYMLILFLFLIPRLLKRKDTMQPALKRFHSPGSGRTRFAILLVDASQALQEGARETACLKIRQQLEVVLHLLCFHLFNEVDGASTCDLSLNCLRRIQFAPESPDFIIFTHENLVKKPWGLGAMITSLFP
jgi:hypothetical protein